MRFLYRIPILIILFFSMQTIWACMPHSPNDVFIARLQSSQPTLMDNQQKGFDLQFSNSRFVFRTLKMWFFYSTPEHWQSDFELKGIQPNDLVIGLAYAASGNEPANYTVASLATLSCKNDKLIVGKPLVSFLAWNRVEGKCGHDSSYKVGILDGFIDEDQAYYLQQLQDKYPTCNKLNAAYPSSTDKSGLSNSTDSVNTHSTLEQESHPQTSFWEKVKFWFGQWI
ncbi:hypothetical protein AOC03_01410 [Psychrobacter urativorans]|uniref:Uncharacterized protein n=2 Tax=Psychrobacter urativorans TaxID=45610 RepID=A0A0M4T678_9GAMM|nr:hypothetical protein AOC03_01410 [Psychrobacter urativorans]